MHQNSPQKAHILRVYSATSSDFWCNFGSSLCFHHISGASAELLECIICNLNFRDEIKRAKKFALFKDNEN